MTDFTEEFLFACQFPKYAEIPEDSTRRELVSICAISGYTWEYILAEDNNGDVTVIDRNFIVGHAAMECARAAGPQSEDGKAIDREKLWGPICECGEGTAFAIACPCGIYFCGGRVIFRDDDGPDEVKGPRACGCYRPLRDADPALAGPEE